MREMQPWAHRGKLPVLMRKPAMLLLPLTLSMGCGGATAAPNDSTAGGASSDASGGMTSTASGGRVATGGLSGTAGATSLAHGAGRVTVQYSPTATTGFGCAASHTLIWGQLDAAGSASPIVVVVDGQNGGTVTCAWSGSFDTNLSGELGAGSNSIRFRVTVAASASWGTAQVAVFDSQLQLTMSDQNCTAELDRSTESADAFTVQLSCDRLRSLDDSFLWCGLRGTLLFEDCQS